jgi:2-polyprenyl-3-methyl-5-hydroxy-6-metoxy-1,4-benzoquinol methylase
MITKIAKDLYNTCYLVEKSIVQQPESKAKLWAKSNSIRHAHVIKSILKQTFIGSNSNIKILNASGMASGHQDFSICEYLIKNNINVKWTAFESPSSPYLNNSNFKNKIEKLPIDLFLIDLNNNFLQQQNTYDVIVFTEIAEHLDYTTLLSTLENIREMMDSESILILTTPNSTNIIARLMFLFGRGDFGYFGDGLTNKQKGLYGHIVYYDIRRMRGILEDIGFSIDEQYTFDYMKLDLQSNNFVKARIVYAIKKIAVIIPNARDTLFIVAKKADTIRKPFSI